MKNLMVGTAIILVYIIVTTVAFDSKMMVEKIDELGHISKELSATGALFLDYKKGYAEGELIFNDPEGIKAIDGQIKELMKLNSDYSPLDNSYWQSNIKYKTYFYDESGICRVYENKELKDEFKFDFPYLHKDNDLDYKETIAKPTVVVSIDAGIPRVRVKSIQEELKNKRIIKASGYTWEEYSY